MGRAAGWATGCSVGGGGTMGAYFSVLAFKSDVAEFLAFITTDGFS